MHLSVSIAQGSDDANESSSTATVINLSQSIVTDDVNEWLGFRFQNVAIAPGATIISAHMSVTVESLNDNPDHNIWGEASDDAATFTINPSDISSRSRTTATAHWQGTDVSPRADTPDLAAIIQEIVNRPGWVSGNAIAILIEGIAPAGSPLRTYMFESGDPATLEVEVADFVSTFWNGMIERV